MLGFFSLVNLSFVSLISRVPAGEPRRVEEKGFFLPSSVMLRDMNYTADKEIIMDSRNSKRESDVSTAIANNNQGNALTMQSLFC